MDFLKRLYEMRLAQLDTEKRNDAVLATCENGKEFLLAIRELNRNLSEKLYKSSLYDSIDISEKNIKIMESVYPKNFSCDKIGKLMEEITKLNT